MERRIHNENRSSLVAQVRAGLTEPMDILNTVLNDHRAVIYASQPKTLKTPLDNGEGILQWTVLTIYTFTSTTTTHTT